MNRNRINAAPRAAAILSLLFALARPAVAAPAFEVTLKPESASIISGAPLKFEVGFTNHAAEPATLNFREDGREALAFSIRNEAGKEVVSADYFKPRGGADPQLSVAKDATETRGAYLNRWISTKLPAGNYEVRGRAHYRIGTSKDLSEAMASFKITVLPCEPGQATAQLEALREMAQNEAAPAGITAAVPVKATAANDPAGATRREARTRIAMADFDEAPNYRSLILCACIECGAVDFDDVTTRIKTRPSPADIQMLTDVVMQGQCYGAGRSAARAALAEIYISSHDEALKRTIRPALNVRLPK